jgi:hypothetical protein
METYIPWRRNWNSISICRRVWRIHESKWRRWSRTWTGKYRRHENVLRWNYAMIDNGQIKDAKTIMLLQYAKINNLIWFKTHK